MTTETLPATKTAADAAPVERTWSGRAFRPDVDILENTEELVVTADLPGVRREDVDIQFENGTLTLHARVAPRASDDRQNLLSEYEVGDYFRSFTVGEMIDTSGITASMANGVLTLRLPKVEAARPRKIEVRAN